MSAMAPTVGGWVNAPDNSEGRSQLQQELITGFAEGRVWNQN